MFEYHITFADGGAWTCYTEENPLDVCERMGIAQDVVNVETVRELQSV